MKSKRVLLRVAPFAVFVAILIFLAVGLTKDPRSLPSNMIDRPLPKFALTELKSKSRQISNKDLSGRITLLNVFGSWCQACLIEHPTLLRMNEMESFDLVGINWRDTRPNATRWLLRFGDPYDYILFDSKSDLAIELGVTGAPETFIVDKVGRIRYKHTGPISDEVFETKIQPVIASLIAEIDR